MAISKQSHHAQTKLHRSTGDGQHKALPPHGCEHQQSEARRLLTRAPQHWPRHPANNGALPALHPQTHHCLTLAYVRKSVTNWLHLQFFKAARAGPMFPIATLPA
jgi:hypothetical protein